MIAFIIFKLNLHHNLIDWWFVFERQLFSAIYWPGCGLWCGWLCYFCWENILVAAFWFWSSHDPLCFLFSHSQPFEAGDLLLGLNFSKVLSSLVALNKVTAGQPTYKHWERMLHDNCGCFASASVWALRCCRHQVWCIYMFFSLFRYQREQRLGVYPALFIPPY